MTFTHTVWAEQVATDAHLPDERLQSRLTAILVDTLEHPSASIPQATDDAGQAKATYRFYANPRVATAALHQAFATETARRCLDHDAVLVVQDTTTLNFTPLQHSIPELGPIDSGGLARGVHLHTALALTLSGQSQKEGQARKRDIPESRRSLGDLEKVIVSTLCSQLH